MRIFEKVNRPLWIEAVSRRSNLATIVQPMIDFVGPLPFWASPIVVAMWIFLVLGPIAVLFRSYVAGRKRDSVLALVSLSAFLGSSPDWCGDLVTWASVVFATALLGIDISSIVRRRANRRRPS